MIIAAVKGEAHKIIKGRGARASVVTHPLYMLYVRKTVVLSEHISPPCRPRNYFTQVGLVTASTSEQKK
jgi:hypothetical protein